MTHEQINSPGVVGVLLVIVVFAAIAFLVGCCLVNHVRVARQRRLDNRIYKARKAPRDLT
jgi:hypothetical protein